jgi:hypothetical protein
MQNPRLKQKEKLDTRLDKTLQTIVLLLVGDLKILVSVVQIRPRAPFTSKINNL